MKRKPLAAPRKTVYIMHVHFFVPSPPQNARKVPEMKAKPILIASLVTWLCLVALAGWSAPPSSVEQVPRLSNEDVRNMLGKPDVVIVDIRYIKQYEESDRHIPGAVFTQPDKLDEFVKSQPKKDATYVLY